MPRGGHFQRLTPGDYQEIRDMKARGITQVRIAAYIGTTQCHISRILRGQVVAARNGLSTIPPVSQP